MRRIAIYVAGVMLLAALLLALQQKTPDESDNTPTSIKDIANNLAPGDESSSSKPAEATAAALRPRRSSALRDPQDRTLEATTPSPAKAGKNPESTAPTSGGHESQSEQAHDAADPTAVIGRPFPVSQSALADCSTSLKSLGETSPCYSVQKHLAQLASEPRDSNWALKTESNLRQYLESDPGKCTIRAIECRTSICAVECASLYGLYVGPDYDFRNENRLGLVDHMWGYESDQSGARITVTVIALKRR